MERKCKLQRGIALCLAFVMMAAVFGYAPPVWANETPVSALVAKGENFTTTTGMTTEISGFSEERLTHVELIITHSYLSPGNGRSYSLFLELSDGSVVGVRWNAANTNNNDGLMTNFGFGRDTLANFTRRGSNPDITGFTNVANITGTFPNMNDRAVTGTAENVFDIRVTIENGVLNASLRAAGAGQAFNGVVNIGPVTVGAGVTINSFSGWTNESPAVINISEWRLYESAAGFSQVGNVTRIEAELTPERLILDWNSVATATRYEITVTEVESGNVLTPIFVPHDGEADSQGHIITEGLRNGVEYRVSVIAHNRWTQSENDIGVTIMPTLAAVSEITAIGRVGGADVSWNPVGGALFYRVYRAAGVEGGTFAFIGQSGITSFADNGLEPGYYRWRVVPVNFAGASEFEPVYSLAEVTAVTVAPSGIPQNFSVVTQVYSQTASLSWGAVEYASAYDVYYRQYPSGGWSAPVTVNRLYHTFTHLQDEQLYQFAVRARNQIGAAEERAYSEAAEVSLPQFRLMAGTWFETAFAYWYGEPGLTYNVHVRLSGSGEGGWRWVNNPAEPVEGLPNWRNDHSPLVRLVNADTWLWRADVPGLRALSGESYDLRVTELGGEGRVTIAEGLTPAPFDRQGFAFAETSPAGHTSGGYNPDGTIPANAVVIYINNANLSNFANPWHTGTGWLGLFPGSRGRNRTASQTLTTATPLIIRFMGTVRSSGDPPQIYRTANITLEGIGPDAVLDGKRLRAERSVNIVIRNLTFQNWGDEDAIYIIGDRTSDDTYGPLPNMNSTDDSASNGTQSSNTWITHNRFIVDSWDPYTRSGVYPDGLVDMARTTYFTQSWNQFGPANRAGLANGARGDGHFRATYHNNHYVNINQRAPRLRASEAHIFNNFYDNSPGTQQVYSIGAGHHAHIIAEGNYFSNASFPFGIANQGGIGGGFGDDHPGFIVTTLTTRANHSSATHRHLEERIFDIAENLVPNQFTNSPVNAAVDQGFPTTGNRLAGRAFWWQRYGNSGGFITPQDIMPVRVTSAEVAREQVIAHAGPMRGADLIVPPTPTPTPVYLDETQITTLFEGENVPFNVEGTGGERVFTGVGLYAPAAANEDTAVTAAQLHTSLAGLFTGYNNELKIFYPNGTNVANTSSLGTGMILEISLNAAGTNPLRIPIAVRNDLNGDGLLTEADIIFMAQHIIHGTEEAFTLNAKAQLTAAGITANAAVPTQLAALIRIAQSAVTGTE